jgi:hypothetical protein
MYNEEMNCKENMFAKYQLDKLKENNYSSIEEE